MFAQQLLNGVVVGAVYALFSLGLTLVFGVHQILNLAHGAVLMWGAMIGLFIVTLTGLPLPAALALGMALGGFLSVVLDLVAFQPLRSRQGDHLTTIVSSIGANLILISIAQQITGAQTLSFPFGTFPVRIYSELGLRISLQQITIVAAVAVMIVALFLYLFRTRMGVEVRAVALNERMAMLLGVNPRFVYFQTFFIAGALAGAAGVILGVAFNAVSYQMGDAVMLQAFVVVVLGGMGSVPGAVCAGLFLGVVQTLTSVFISSQLSDAILFGLLFLLLLVRPTGLFAGLHAESRRV